MFSILITFIDITAVKVLLHRPFGPPHTDAISALNASGWLTAVFVAHKHGPETLNALSIIVAGFTGTGPSG